MSIRNLPPHKELVLASSFATSKETALDIGPGESLRDAQYLSRAGFKDIALVDKDSNNAITERVKRSQNFQFHKSDFCEFDYGEEVYDLVNSQYAILLCKKSYFPYLYSRVVSSLKIGGVLSINLMGRLDDWNTSSSEMFFCSRTDALALAKGLEILVPFDEGKVLFRKLSDGGIKKWHVFNLILRKK